jgi:hypothetical protein
MKLCACYQNNTITYQSLRITSLNTYLIYDENQELMRKVSKREEADQIVSGRVGWTYKLLRCKKKPINLTQFQEALF